MSDYQIDEDQLNAAMELVQQRRLAALTDPPPPIALDTPPPTDETPPEEPEETPPVEPPVEPEQPTTIEINGETVDLTDVTAALEFNKLLQTNPALMQRITDAVRTPLNQPYEPNVRLQEPAPPPPPPPSITIPDDIDPDDPNTKFLINQLQTLQDNYNQIQSQTTQFNEYIALQNQQVIENSIAIGKADFRTSFPHITDSDMTQLEQEIQRTNILFGLAQSGSDLPTATKEAFERSMWSVPEIRDRILHAQEIVSLEQKREDNERKAKLNALSGSTSNTPRVPTPQTPADKKAAMIADIAANMAQRASN